MPYRYQSLNGVKKYLDIMFEKHKQDWDTVVAICGQVGVGKSNLALHMLEYWTKKLKKKIQTSDIKHMCLDTPSFLKDLSDCKKYEMTVYDEAGELSSRRAMSKLNNAIMVTYQIIRADNIFTILVLPDIWYLDNYFRNTRVKGIFYVHKRGKVSFWSNSKVKKMMVKNQTRPIKNYWVTHPTFTDSFPIYKGILAEEYKKLKQKKTTEARKKILDNGGLVVNDVLDRENEIIGNGLRIGLTKEQISNLMDCTIQTVYNRINQYQIQN